jgi:hypothetical protein
MNNLILGLLGIYTFAMVWGIHHYEAKLRKVLHWLSELEEDHFQTFNAYCNMSELVRQYKSYSNAEHYTHLQLENAALKAQIEQYKQGISTLHSGIHTGYPSVSESAGMNSGHYGQFYIDSKAREDEMNRINAEKYDKERKLWEPDPVNLDEYSKLQQVWKSGGMGIVKMDLVSNPHENQIDFE